jgi:hypothetical protein
MRKPTAKELVLGCIAIAVIATLINGIIERTGEPKLSEEFKERIRRNCDPLKDMPRQYQRCMEPIEGSSDRR